MIRVSSVLYLSFVFQEILAFFFNIKNYDEKFNFCLLPHLFLFIQLSTAGGRLVICSDGVWDALSAEEALDSCRGMSAEAAAPHIVKVRLIYIF